jgi:hypothetical protein
MRKSKVKYEKKFSEITNINAMSSSFDFLYNEPDIYGPGYILERKNRKKKK